MDVWDTFLNYGSLDPIEETRFDMLCALEQSPASLFYARQESCNMADYENQPHSFFMEIGIRFSIMNWLTYRDMNLQNDSKRIALSQKTILIKKQGDQLNIDIAFIPLVDINRAEFMSYKKER